MILYVPQPTPTIATQIFIFTDYHPPDLRCSACRFCQLDRLVSFDRRPVSRTSSQEANTLGNPRASSVVGTGAWVLPEMFLANSGKWGPIMSNPSQNQCCSVKEIITRKHAGAEKDHQSPAVPGCNSHPPKKLQVVGARFCGKKERHNLSMFFSPQPTETKFHMFHGLRCNILVPDL